MAQFSLYKKVKEIREFLRPLQGLSKTETKNNE